MITWKKVPASCPLEKHARERGPADRAPGCPRPGRWRSG